MNISAAFASVSSGLAATTRQAAVISSNVANATTPGYGKREVVLSPVSYGGLGQGVKVVGISRQSDVLLANERRNAQASAAGNGRLADFLVGLEGLYGGTGTAGALLARINAFDAALLEASGAPDSTVRLATAVETAKTLAAGLNDASKAIQAERVNADRAIASAVDTLNASLAQIQKLNVQIASHSGAGRDASALLDQRQALVDKIATLIPVHEVQRDHNQIALISTTGAILLDGTASKFEFTPVQTIVPEMTRASGALSSLTLNGRVIETNGVAATVNGGELSALFKIRDELAVQGQAQLDALARDVIERFSTAGLDPTLMPGAAGLFTDSGSAFNSIDELGLSSRIRINSAVDPAAGGYVSRLRDGLGATTTGPIGNTSLLLNLSNAMSEIRPTSSSAVPAGSRNLSQLASALTSSVAGQRLLADNETSFSTARLNALTDIEARGGVNTDEEMRSLLVVEQVYAANAKVLQALDDMLKILMGI